MKALSLLPSKLEDVYHDTLARTKEQSESDAALALCVLQWISYSKRPLKVDELRQTLAVEWDGHGELPNELDVDNILDQESLVDVCAGLVVIEAESKIVRLVHYTTEYFRKTGASLFPDAQSMIARTCLVYLSFEVFTDTPEWWRLCSPRPHYRLYSEKTQLRRKQFSFFQYTASYWQDHLKQCPELQKDVVLEDLALRVLYEQPGILMLPESIVKTNFEAGQDCQPQKCILGLHVAASFGLETIVAAILNTTQISVNCRHTSRKRSPVHFAVLGGHENVIKLLLLQNSIKVDIKDHMDWTGLHMTASRSNLGTVELLLRSGANVEARTSSKKTVLHIAGFRSEPGTIKLLLRSGVNIQARDNNGSTALHSAANGGDTDNVEILLQAGANIDARDNNGSTALHLAIDCNRMATVEYLLHFGANIEAVDKWGRTALHSAGLAGLRDAVKMLLQGAPTSRLWIRVVG
ncbi:hypothetical protein MMC30_005732 [Trapelia coarctata]|nr:hypothetical protein [Trapelia coarctata]